MDKENEKHLDDIVNGQNDGDEPLNLSNRQWWRDFMKKCKENEKAKLPNITLPTNPPE